MPIAEIYLGLGSNLGDREQHLRSAVRALADAGVTALRCASLFATAPRDIEDQPWFLNTVLEVRTLLEPEALLAAALAIERTAGRVRDRLRGPRPLDIDILLYRDRLLDTPNLIVPHPRYRSRRFVLTPLAELAPELADPATGLTMQQLLELCRDPGDVRRAGDPIF